MNEAQQLELLSRQHPVSFPVLRFPGPFPTAAAPPGLIETKHEQTLYVPYVFRNHLI
jgi:hypothetical protein